MTENSKAFYFALGFLFGSTIIFGIIISQGYIPPEIICLTK